MLKNIRCFNDISYKNKNIYNKYIKDNEPNMPKKDGNIYENDNDSFNEKKKLNEIQKKYIYLISKMCKLQQENIEIKYNYVLIKDELSKKNKIIKDLQKKIEFRDLTIKEKFKKDKEDHINKELDEKYKLLLSMQQKSLTFRENNIDLKEDEIKGGFREISSYNTQENNSTRKRKKYSFHPRNSSYLKSNTISNYLKSKNSESPIKKLLLSNKIETNTEIRNGIYHNSDNQLNLFNFDKNLYPSEYNDIIGKEFNEIIKNFNIEEKTELNFGIKKNLSKNIDDVINEDDIREETNNKTLKSLLNDIQTVNSNIHNRLSIIEKKQNTYNNSIIIKPISRTMSNIGNMNKLINEITECNNKINNAKSNDKINSKKTKPFTDKKQKKKKIKNCNIEINYNCFPNKNDLKIMNNKINRRKNDIITKKVQSEKASTKLIIKTNNQRNRINNQGNNRNLVPKIQKDLTKENINLNEKKKTKEDKEKKLETNLKNNNNLPINNLTNPKMINDEKLKLQIFYSEHLNKFKANKQKKIITKENINTFISNNKMTNIHNNDSISFVDMKTNHDSIEKKSKKIK